MKPFIILSIAIAVLSCKPRRNIGAELLAAPSDELEILQREYREYKQYAQEIGSFIDAMELDPTKQARYFRNIYPNRSDRRKFIENNFGPSDYMTNQLTLMFENRGFTEDELINFVKAYAKSDLDIKPTETNVLFGYKSILDKFITIPRTDRILNKSDILKKDARDSAPGFSKWSVDGLKHPSGVANFDGSPLLTTGAEVRGRLTKIFFRERNDKNLVFELYAYPDKAAFKIKITAMESVLDDYHLFIRFLRDQNSPKLAAVLADLKTTHLAEEQNTWKYMVENHDTRQLKQYSLTGFLDFVPPHNFIFIVPDIHDQMLPQKLVEMQLAATPRKWDWIAIEAPLDCQEEIDSQKIDQARCLKEVLAAANYDRKWTTSAAREFFPPVQEQSLMVLLKTAISNSIKVHFIDAAIKYKGGWPFSDLLAFKTRNWIFANRTPKQGRGIIFGGLWHFNDVKDNVQDFLGADVDPDSLGILSLN